MRFLESPVARFHPVIVFPGIPSTQHGSEPAPLAAPIGLSISDDNVPPTHSFPQPPDQALDLDYLAYVKGAAPRHSPCRGSLHLLRSLQGCLGVWTGPWTSAVSPSRGMTESVPNGGMTESVPDVGEYPQEQHPCEAPASAP